MIIVSQQVRLVFPSFVLRITFFGGFGGWGVGSVFYCYKLVRTFDKSLKVQSCKVLSSFFYDHISKIFFFVFFFYFSFLINFLINIWSIFYQLLDQLLINLNSLNSDLFICTNVSLTSFVKWQCHASNLLTIYNCNMFTTHLKNNITQTASQTHTHTYIYTYIIYNIYVWYLPLKDSLK